MKTFEYND